MRHKTLLVLAALACFGLEAATGQPQDTKPPAVDNCCCNKAVLQPGHPYCDLTCHATPVSIDCDIDNAFEEPSSGHCYETTVHDSASCVSGASKTFTAKEFTCSGPVPCKIGDKDGLRCKSEEVPGSTEEVTVQTCTGVSCGAGPGDVLCSNEEGGFHTGGGF